MCSCMVTIERVSGTMQIYGGRYMVTSNRVSGTVQVYGDKWYGVRYCAYIW